MLGCRSEWRKIAKPDKQVIVAHGDGSFGLNALELDAAVRHNIAILVVVSLAVGPLTRSATSPAAISQLRRDDRCWPH